ncbi:MAG: secretin N-terminal domain-containing protein [Magnetococcales bacterium]|nr:secretin N-terminal domain-containing protein [Magnetococcales bacterium]
MWKSYKFLLKRDRILPVSLLLVGLLLVGCAGAVKPPVPAGGDINSVNGRSLEAVPGVGNDPVNPPAATPAPPRAADPAAQTIPEAPIPPIAGSTPFLLPEGEARPPLATYTLSMIDAPLREVLFSLARDAELNVDIYPGIDDKITINAVNQTLPAILDRIADQSRLQYQIKEGVLLITPDKPFRRSYPLNYLQTKRESKSGMSVSTQMSSSEGRNDGSNGSNVTLTASDSAADFWENLVANITHMVDPAENREGKQPEANAARAAARGEESAATKDPAANPYVVLNRATGVVNVLATHRQHKQVQAFIDRVMRIAMRQVFIEATVVSVELSDAYQAGVDWSLLASTVGTADPNNSQSMINQRMTDGPHLSLKLNRTKVPFLSGVLGEHDLTATLRLLSQFGNAKVVSTPKVTVLNNQTAVLRVTTNQVYFEIKVTPATVQTSTGGAQTLIPGTTQTLVRTAPVGFIMQVTPQIDANNMITMNIRPTLQRISQWVDNPDPNMRINQTTGAAFTPPQIPVIQVQEMDSVLRVSSGQVAVMGGLMQDESKNGMDGIPYLSKVPVLGSLFSYRSEGNIKKELVIFLRPVILNETDELRTIGTRERHLFNDRPFDNYWGQTGGVIP